MRKSRILFEPILPDRSALRLFDKRRFSAFISRAQKKICASSIKTASTAPWFEVRKRYLQEVLAHAAVPRGAQRAAPWSMPWDRFRGGSRFRCRSLPGSPSFGGEHESCQPTGKVGRKQDFLECGIWFPKTGKRSMIQVESGHKITDTEGEHQKVKGTDSAGGPQFIPLGVAHSDARDLLRWIEEGMVTRVSRR
jgi:hypothetical protein